MERRFGEADYSLLTWSSSSTASYPGSGPDANEAGIENLYANWGSQKISGDEFWSQMSDGTIFLDWDEDGYYDDALRYGDGGTWNWDTTSSSWVWHDFPPDEPNGVPKNVDNGK